MFHVLAQAVSHSGDIVHHVQQHFQFRFQLRHYSLLPYQKLQARQLRQLGQNIQALPVLIYTFTELLAGISLAAIEQWGINTGGAVRTSTLPIPFTNVFLAVASTSSEWCCPGCSATNTTVTTRAYQSNRPDVAQPNDVNWIIIGCQPQWGFTNNTGRPYITFPFKFSNVFTAISCICHNGSPSEANTVYNVSISGMNIGASGGGSGKYWCAFGVAQQQWRNNPGLWAIPFTEFVAGGITMTRTGSQSSGTWYGDSGTISLTGYTASCATNESWVSNISGSAIAVGL